MKAQKMNPLAENELTESLQSDLTYTVLQLDLCFCSACQVCWRFGPGL